MEKELDYIGHRKRLNDRFMYGGGQSMADYEMLELLLTFAIPRKDTKPLAKALIKEFGSYAAVINASDEKLMAFSGLKEKSILVFRVIKESALRLAWEKLESSNLPVMATWDGLIDYCRTAVGHSEREELHIIFLNAKNAVIGKELQQRGTIDSVAIHPVEVVRSAVLKNAKSIVLVHNHPSGDVTPSSADILVTNKVNEGLKAIDIRLLDHLIISKSNVYSFNEHKLIKN